MSEQDNAERGVERRVGIAGEAMKRLNIIRKAKEIRKDTEVRVYEVLRIVSHYTRHVKYLFTYLLT